MNAKEEKGSTLLLKLFAIIFSLFLVYGYVFVHTADAVGKIIFQKADTVCNASSTCFSMEVLYLMTLLAVATLGFLTITLTTMEWTTQRDSGFYRNFVAFLNCIKIAIAVLFTTMFISYSRATWVIPLAVLASLFLDSYVWNKRCHEANEEHESLLLDVVNEFMNIFTTKKSRLNNTIRYRHSFVFYIVAFLFITFCIHAISVHIKPNFDPQAIQDQAIATTVAPAEQYQASTVRSSKIANTTAKAKLKKKQRKKIVATRVEPVKDTVSVNSDDDDEDWW